MKVILRMGILQSGIMDIEETPDRKTSIIVNKRKFSFLPQGKTISKPIFYRLTFIPSGECFSIDGSDIEFYDLADIMD